MASLIKSTNSQSIFEKVKNSSSAKLLAESSRYKICDVLNLGLPFYQCRQSVGQQFTSIPTVGRETFWEALLYFKLSLTQFV